MLKSRKINALRDAYFYLASLPPEILVFIEAEVPNSTVNSKIRGLHSKSGGRCGWLFPLPSWTRSAFLTAPSSIRSSNKSSTCSFRGKARISGRPHQSSTVSRRNQGRTKKKEEKDKKKRKGSEPAASAKADAKNRGKEAQGGGSAQAPAAAKSAAHETARVSAGTAIGAKAQKKHEEAGAMRAAAKRPLPAKAKASGKRSRGK